MLRHRQQHSRGLHADDQLSPTLIADRCADFAQRFAFGRLPPWPTSISTARFASMTEASAR
jgi:hypothetical protein